MTFTINSKLPSLNDYVNACRTNRYKAAQMKKDIENIIAFDLRNMPKYDEPIKLKFTWVEGNKRRDLDNVAFAKKFILDALVKMGKLKDDNRKCVTGFIDAFEYGPETKVIIEVIEDDKRETK